MRDEGAGLLLAITRVRNALQAVASAPFARFPRGGDLGRSNKHIRVESSPPDAALRHGQRERVHVQVLKQAGRRQRKSQSVWELCNAAIEKKLTKKLI